MTEQLEKVQEKIRKMLALAQNAGTPEEAATAAELAQRLQLKYAIDEETMLRLRGQGAAGAPEPVEAELLDLERKPGPFPDWHKFLASGMARPMLCYVYSIRGRGLYVVGRRTDRESLRYTFAHLKRTIEELAEAGARAVEETYRADCAARGSAVRGPEVWAAFDGGKVRWKRSFCVGATQTISAKLAQSTRLLAGRDASGTTALVLASRYDLAQKHVDPDGKFRGQHVSTNYTGSALRDGRAAGHGIGLDGARGGRLGGGSKRLGTGS